MTKPLQSPALAAFVAATAGRNMTSAASIAVAPGIGAMVPSTMDGAHEAGHRWIVAQSWGCLALFRRRTGRAGSAGGAEAADRRLPAVVGPGLLVDTASVTAVPAAPLLSVLVPVPAGAAPRPAGHLWPHPGPAGVGCEIVLLGHGLRSANIDLGPAVRAAGPRPRRGRVLMLRHPDLAQSIDAEARRRAMENRT